MQAIKEQAIRDILTIAPEIIEDHSLLQAKVAWILKGIREYIDEDDLPGLCEYLDELEAENTDCRMRRKKRLVNGAVEHIKKTVLRQRIEDHDNTQFQYIQREDHPEFLRMGITAPETMDYDTFCALRAEYHHKIA